MTDLKATLRQALEALECYEDSQGKPQYVLEAIANLRTALASKEPAPQDSLKESSSPEHPSSTVSDSRPAGAAPLPEDVREMVERLRKCWGDALNDKAADMLEQLARERDEGVKAQNELHEHIEQLRARIAELEKDRDNYRNDRDETYGRLFAAECIISAMKESYKSNYSDKSDKK